jgi:uncharacterized protein
MKKMWLMFILAVATAVIAHLVIAQPDQYHLKLLAVQESGDGYEGSDADLFLELKGGTGRVFLDTFPATKMDTQISTRFAKEIACKHFNLNCNKYDFIFTIRAKSNIVGGPSAGAAVAALTTIAVLDLDYDDLTTITGTINSGGIVGPVGGVKEKLEAASRIGLRKVLIAKGTGESFTVENSTGNETGLNLIDYAKENLSLMVEEVINLDEVIFAFTGTNLHKVDVNVTADHQYSEIMQGLQNLLCNRVDKIRAELDGFKLSNATLEIVEQRMGQAVNSTENGDFYSAASFCFGTNIQLKRSFYQEKNISLSMVDKLFAELEKKVNILQGKVDVEKIETIADLQTYMVVKERLSDVNVQIRAYQDSNTTVAGDYYGSLAYAEERYFSAVSWMQFFAMDGKKFVFDSDKLMASCHQKIAEAEEREQYAGLFLGSLPLSNIRDKISKSKESLEAGEYALCLITAAQAKGDANAIISSLGLREDSVGEFLQSKSRAVERIIAKNSVEGVFPILGYSYYQYANSLKRSEPFTSLLYLEYALEMSDLGIYFPEEHKFLESVQYLRVERELVFFFVGLALGVFATIQVIGGRKEKSKGKRNNKSQEKNNDTSKEKRR